MKHAKIFNQDDPRYSDNLQVFEQLYKQCATCIMACADILLPSQGELVPSYVHPLDHSKPLLLWRFRCRPMKRSVRYTQNEDLWLASLRTDMVSGVRRRSTSCSYNKRAWGLQPVVDLSTDARVVEEATRCLAVAPEDVPTNWQEQISSIVSAERERMTFHPPQETPVYGTSLGPPSVTPSEAHLACRGGCGFFGVGEAMLCPQCTTTTQVSGRT
jgi:hypothetical protein